MVSKPDFKRDFAILSRRENKSESGDQPGVRRAKFHRASLHGHALQDARVRER